MTDHTLLQTELSIKDAIHLLASFAQAVNPKLGAHMARVAELACQVGEAMKLDTDSIDHLEMAAMIHDIGLLSMPKELQIKEIGQLTQAQQLIYSEHPVIAAITLEGHDALSLVGETVLYHHEYMNGKGFPNGLKGDQIPLASRILLAVSDYCRILSTWPRNMRRLLSHARRQLGPDEWKRSTFNDDPECIIQDCAERLLMSDAEGKYDPIVVKTLVRVLHKGKNLEAADLVHIDDLQEGMVMMDDLRLDAGRLLIRKGSELTDSSIKTLQELAGRGMIDRQVYIAMPKKQTDD